MNPQLQPGEHYTVEVRPVNGAERRGIAFSLKLLDERQHPTGEERLVHLDWFMPKELNCEVPLKNVGMGYQTVDEEAEKVEYTQVRYTECVYAVFLKQGDSTRFYVVFLPKEEASK